MSLSPAFLARLQRHGLLLAADITARDDLQLRPAVLSRAAARRLKAGLRALEAYVRRLLLLLALQLETALPQADRPRNPRAPAPRQSARSCGLRVFAGEHDPPDNLRDWQGAIPAECPPHGGVQAAPLMARLTALKALIAAPDARARRLAFHLSRRRPGLLLASDAGNAQLPRRFGTEVSMLYAALAPAILAASRARPPPLGPAPRPGPRLRRLTT